MVRSAETLKCLLEMDWRESKGFTLILIIVAIDITLGIGSDLTSPKTLLVVCVRVKLTRSLYRDFGSSY